MAEQRGQNPAKCEGSDQSAASPYPTAITGIWSDVERTAWHIYETIDRDTTDWELAEAVLVLLGEHRRALLDA